MSEPTAEERFRHALRTTVADVMPHLAQSLESAFDEVMAGRAVQDGLHPERLAEGLHAEQANREVGCGNHTESYDDHMEWHRGQAGRILRHILRAAPPLHDPVAEAD